MNVLDPHPCTRCARPVAPEETDRPEWVSSTLFVPVTPRQVPWMVAADHAAPGSIAALLCPDCATTLKRWLYLGRAAPSLTTPGVVAAVAPAP